MCTEWNEINAFQVDNSLLFWKLILCTRRDGPRVSTVTVSFYYCHGVYHIKQFYLSVFHRAFQEKKNSELSLWLKENLVAQLNYIN